MATIKDLARPLRHITASTLSAAATLSISACYDGGTAEDTFGGNMAPPQRDNVKIVPAEELAQIASVSASGALQVAATPWWGEILIDDILVMGVSEHTPEGLLRRVTGVRTAGDRLELDTTQGMLTDVFEAGHFSLQTPLSASGVDRVLTAEEGVSITPPAPTPLVDGRPGFRELEGEGVIPFSFKNVVLFDADGKKSTTHDRIVLNGDFKARLDMNVDLDLGWSKIDKFSTSISAGLSSDINVVANPELERSGDKTLLEATLTPIVIPIAFVPIVIVPKVELIASYSAKIAGFGVAANLHDEITVTAIAERIDGNWTSGIDGPKIVHEFTPPSLGKFGGAEITVTVGPRVTTKIYALAGPTLDVNGHLRLAVADSAWHLFAGLAASIGVEFGIGGWDWATLKWKKDIYDKEVEIKSGTLGAGGCGNQIIEADEECDGAALDGQTCMTLGAGSGDLVCAPDCSLDLSNCAAGGCGDGQLAVDEACDGAILDATCQSLGHDGGQVICSDSCEYDESACCEDLCSPGTTDCTGDVMYTCQVSGDCHTWDAGVACENGCNGDGCASDMCGNGVADDNEDCEGAMFKNASCKSLGFNGGSLACTAGCSFDTSQCCLDTFTILTAKYPTYTTAAAGCAVGGGVTLKASAELLANSIRFHVTKSDDSVWGADAVLRLYVGTGPTCGDPINMVKETADVVLNEKVQIINLPIDPYVGGWNDGEVKEFWIGKSEGADDAGRASGAIKIQRAFCN